MVIFVVEVLIIVILVMIFSTIIVDERKNRQRKLRLVKLKGYWDGGERRSVERLDISLGVRYSMNGKKVEVKSADISTKGIKLLLDEKLERGTPLRLEIKLPEQDRIVKTRGEVAWTEESLEDEKNSSIRLFNTGIKFFDFQNADEKHLFDFIYNLQLQKH
ncbi:MAG: PilZ domain-containing protein [Candidatus Omnitrophica bacterium]|nr:PilZ domain-containing protein [Candidatus Omnitrophota bacterium]